MQICFLGSVTFLLISPLITKHYVSLSPSSNRRKETLTIRQTLDNLRLDLSVDDEDDDHLLQEQTNNVTKV